MNLLQMDTTQKRVRRDIFRSGVSTGPCTFGRGAKAEEPGRSNALEIVMGWGFGTSTLCSRVGANDAPAGTLFGMLEPSCARRFEKDWKITYGCDLWSPFPCVAKCSEKWQVWKDESRILPVQHCSCTSCTVSLDFLDFFLGGMLSPPFFSLSPVRRQVQVNLYRDLQAVQLGNKNTVSWADSKHLQSIRQTSWRSRGFALQNQLCFLVRWLQKSAGVKTPTFLYFFKAFKVGSNWELTCLLYFFYWTVD